MLSVAAGLVAALAMQVLLARWLGPAGFGVLGLALAVQHMAMIAQDGGFRVLLMRETAKPSPDLPPVEPDLAAVASGHAAVATVAALVAALVLAPVGDAWIVVLAVAGGLAKTLCGFVSAILIGGGRFAAEANWQYAARVGVSLAAIAAAFAFPDPAFVLLALFVAQAACLLPGLHGARLAWPAPRWNTPAYAFAARISALALMTALYFRTGPFFIYWFTGDLAEVSHFSLLHRFLDAAIVMVAPVAQIVFFASRRRIDLLSPSLRIWAAIGWAAGLLATAALAFALGPNLVALAAGEAYRPAGRLAGWCVLALAFAGPNYLLMQSLLARHAENRVIASATVAMAAGILASVLLVPRHGAAGAFMAIVCSEAVQLALLVWNAGVAGSVRAQERARD